MVIVRVAGVAAPGPERVPIFKRTRSRWSFRSARAPRALSFTTILRVAPAASLNVTFPTTIRLVRAASAAGSTEVAVTVNEQPGPPAGHDPMSPVPTTNDDP